MRTGALVTDIEPDRVRVRRGEEMEEIATRTVVWAAGVRGVAIAPLLAKAAGAEVDRIGRVIVRPDLTVGNRTDIFAIGDMAHTPAGDGPLPGVAPVAIQQGKYVARVIAARLQGRTVEPFRYRDYGAMATIGRSAAVAEIKGYRVGGFIAWLIWLFVHLMQLVSFANRVLVLLQWAWNYITFNRTARLITGEVTPLREGWPAQLASREDGAGATVKKGSRGSAE